MLKAQAWLHAKDPMRKSRQWAPIIYLRVDDTGHIRAIADVKKLFYWRVTWTTVWKTALLPKQNGSAPQAHSLCISPCKFTRSRLSLLVSFHDRSRHSRRIKHQIFFLCIPQGRRRTIPGMYTVPWTEPNNWLGVQIAGYLVSWMARHVLVCMISHPALTPWQGAILPRVTRPDTENPVMRTLNLRPYPKFRGRICVSDNIDHGLGPVNRSLLTTPQNLSQRGVS